ncbi:MAG: PEGA domain-containing protein [Treponema sp.]|jgi:hypothetical protein|nr:PEGA domain-containing protein [Treponema sp.]
MKFRFPVSGLFFSLLLLGPQLFAQTERPIVGDTIEEIQGQGILIRTEPGNATVYIDGVERGKTPLILNDLRAGEYNIRLVREGFMERRFRVALPLHGRLVVSIELKPVLGQVMLTLVPGGPPQYGELSFEPLIFADGKPAEPGILELPVGYRRIQARAFGWESVDKLVYVREGLVTPEYIEMSPAVFRLSGPALSRPRFNPRASGDLGRVEMKFDVSAPGSGRFAVLDSEGNSIYEERLPPFETWNQSFRWNGRDKGDVIVPGGNYTLLVEARGLDSETEAAPVQLSQKVEIDESLSLFPLSLPGGIPGLIFSPSADIIPRGSFQIEGGLLFGAVPSAETPWKSLPAEAGIRFSPLDKLETAAFLSGITRFDGEKALWGAGFSAKWLFRKAEESAPFSAAALLHFSWAEEGGLSPLHAGDGLGFAAPFSWRFPIPLSLLFSPGILWYEPWSKIGEGGAPHILLPAGILFQQPAFSLGASLRPAFDLKKPGFASLQFGGEFKFYPSTLVFSLLGGARYQPDPEIMTAFAGFLVGIIY